MKKQVREPTADSFGRWTKRSIPFGNVPESRALPFRQVSTGATRATQEIISIISDRSRYRQSQIIRETLTEAHTGTRSRGEVLYNGFHILWNVFHTKHGGEVTNQRWLRGRARLPNFRCQRQSNMWLSARTYRCRKRVLLHPYSSVVYTLHHFTIKSVPTNKFHFICRRRDLI